MNILVNGIVKTFDDFDSVRGHDYIESVLDCFSCDTDTTHFDTDKNVYVMSKNDFQRLNDTKDKLLAVSRLISKLDDNTLSEFYRMLYVHFSSILEESVVQQLSWLAKRTDTAKNNIIQSFLKEQKEKNPDNTYKALKADCKILDQYLSENQKQLFSLIGSQEACEYISFLSSKCAPRTVKRKVCTLRKLLEWCKNKGYLPAEIKIDISDNIIMPEREFAKTEDIALLYKRCCHIFEADEYTLARAKMETLLIILCGFKLSELAEMKLSDISEGKIDFTDDFRRKRIRLVSTDIIKEPLNQYLIKRREIVKNLNVKSDNMFLSIRGGVLTSNLIGSDFDTVRQISGTSVTSASVRNSCIKYYYNEITDDLLIGKLFGISQRWAELCSK